MSLPKPSTLQAGCTCTVCASTSSGDEAGQDQERSCCCSDPTLSVACLQSGVDHLLSLGSASQSVSQSPPVSRLGRLMGRRERASGLLPVNDPYHAPRRAQHAGRPNVAGLIKRVRWHCRQLECRANELPKLRHHRPEGARGGRSTVAKPREAVDQPVQSKRPAGLKRPTSSTPARQSCCHAQSAEASTGL